MTSLARSTAIMSIGTVLSRTTGLLRVAAIAAALGAVETQLADTYNIANTAPNIIYELVLGGVLTSVFIPVFVELLEKEGRERAWEVASAILNLSLVVLTAIAVIGVIGAPLLAKVYLSRADPAGADVDRVLTLLLRLFIPQIVFYGLAAITAGLLNAHGRFGPPMYTPVLNNVAVIAVFVAFHQAYQRVDASSITTGQVLMIGLGTTAGVVLMALAQLPFLRGLGRYRVRLSVDHPAVRKLARLSVFVVGYVVVNQIGYFIVQLLAYGGRNGAYTAYVYAFTFFMLPHGLFAVSVITALLPGLSEQAVNARWDDFRGRLSTGIRATVFLVLPAALGYLILAERVIELLLEHGIFSGASTELVAGVLRVFVLGLVAFSLFQLFLRAFYALQDSRTPFLINCVSVGLNIAINVAVFPVAGVRGLAAGHASSYFVGLFLQARALAHRIGGLDAKRTVRSLSRIAVAAAGMALVVWASSALLDRVFERPSLVGQLFGVGAPVVVGVAVYLAFSYALKVEELDLIRGIIVRRKATNEAAQPGR